MKITLQQIAEGPEELVIRYQTLTEEIKQLVEILEHREGQLIGEKDGRKHVLALQQIIYFESVDGVTYACMSQEVYRINLPLAAIEKQYEADGFFRCSKGMILNIYRIHSLRSQPGNRIDAIMDNQEHVIISRRFAGELRARLKGGKS